MGPKQKAKKYFSDVSRPRKTQFPKLISSELEVQQPAVEVFVAPEQVDITAAPEILIPEIKVGVQDPRINLILPEHQEQAAAYARKKQKTAAQLWSFSAAAIVLALLFQSAHIFALGQNTKVVLMGTASDALSHLKEAANLASQQQFNDSQKQFALALENFEDAKQNISGMGPVLDALVQLTPKGQSAQKLINAGEAIALAGQNFTDFYNTLAKAKLTVAGFDNSAGFYETLGSARMHLQQGDVYLATANQNLQGIDPNVLPENFRTKFDDYRQQLTDTLGSLKEISDLLGLFQNFVGKGPKTILVLFENNRELRAGGGFIGTYGYYRLNDGKILSQQISSIYDLDGQLKEQIAPPGPFHDLTDHWGLRDSNWFADFPISAQKAISFYEKEGQETPDAVIALTPDMIVDLLKITGPVDLQKYGQTLTAENFRDLVQLNTSFYYDQQENAPKQMLSDFAPILVQKLTSLPPDKYAQVLGALLSNLDQKNILFYDRDPQIQTQFENYNWAGSLAQTDRDYLQIVSSNLGGRKTDLDISQSADLQSAVQPDGSIINTLIYTRSHSPSLLQPTSPNIDYVRFFVPQGSQLLSASGFNKQQAYLSDGSGYQAQPPHGFEVDPDLHAIDATMSVDGLTGTATEQESGKTVFANWIQTDPGQTTTVQLTYRLPFTLNASRKYSLVLQKQPGSTPISFSYAFNSGARLLWYTPYDLQISGTSINYKQDLKSDIFIGAVLDR